MNNARVAPKLVHADARLTGNCRDWSTPWRRLRMLRMTVETGMKYICDAPGNRIWFRIETEIEAVQESTLMRHAVERYFRKEWEKAAQTFRPISKIEIEQQIGLNAHIQKEMPVFLTLRDGAGQGLATAMLPPHGVDGSGDGFRPIIVGPNNTDPYPLHGDAIAKLGEHFGLTLDRDRCFPYRRS